MRHVCKNEVENKKIQEGGGLEKRRGSKSPRVAQTPQPVSSQTTMSVQGALLAQSANSARRPQPLRRARSFVERRTGAGHLSSAPLQRRRCRWEVRRPRGVSAGGATTPCGLERFEEATLTSRSGGEVGWCQRRRSLRREEEFRSGEGERVIGGRVGGQEGREWNRRCDPLSASIEREAVSAFCHEASSTELARLT